jgi:predicted nuclease of predicted toxin-antitoxin system
MRLLFDHNLSLRLVDRLANVYPGSSHVFRLGLDRAPDLEVWRYACEHSFVIVTKDSDFNDLSVLQGFPPKIVWVRLGNCTTSDVERALRAGREAIISFVSEPDLGVLELS